MTARSTGVACSLLCTVLLCRQAEASLDAAAPATTGPTAKPTASVFPILMYDSDIGFGLGVKGVVKDLYGGGESFDGVLFGSTKGEQWYALAFSIPDQQTRLGTSYAAALDVKLEFDKYLRSNFFGFGNDSEDNDLQFPREMTRLEVAAGRALTRRLVAELAFVLNHTSVYGYGSEESALTAEVPGAGERMTTYVTARLRWDSRDCYVHPSSGVRVSLSADRAATPLGSDVDFSRYRGKLSAYRVLLGASDVLAARLWIQHVEGIAPYYERSIVGGGWTARGFKADRFIDDAMALVSGEYRFPIFKCLGGVLFVDDGRVFPSLAVASLRRWKFDGGCGLRYYLRDFVVRLDVGKSEEGVRLFFNFGHVF
jgi:outer membrane protein assembly factor BamA